MPTPDKNELITNQLEKDVTGLILQGYSIFKKFSNQRKASKERCIKCGSYSIRTQFCNTDHIIRSPGAFPKELQHGTLERLHKTCEECNYSYLAIPLDANQ